MSFDEARFYRWVPGNTTAAALEQVLWVLVGVSLIGDITTTFVGLHLGLAETNPVASLVIYSYGIGGMVALKGFAVGVGLVCRLLLPEQFRAVVPTALALPWTVATCVNIYLISTVV